MPGDTVEIRRGIVYVNGEALDEPYIVPEYMDQRSMIRRYVEPGYYFVMGDHRKSFQRQPDVGPGSRKIHLRQSGFPILAGEPDWVARLMPFIGK